jgi:hypothetical protein
MREFSFDPEDSSSPCFTLTYVVVHIVSSNFHRAYDANEWLLLSKTQIVEAYCNNRTTPSTLNIIYGNLFDYSV